MTAHDPHDTDDAPQWLGWLFIGSAVFWAVVIASVLR